MGFIGEIIGYPLGWIMWAIYQVFHNYGIAIVIFTIITRALLTPLSAKQEKSSARMMAFQPKLKALEKKYGKNKEKMQEEQMKLYSEEGINPMGSCLPLLIQFPILFGIIDVVYRPLTHILRFGSDIIEKASKIALDFFTQIS
ncbi:MAG: membrane protein insertase YidC, partial [Oscillospiraceae bacterium]